MIVLAVASIFRFGVFTRRVDSRPSELPLWMYHAQAKRVLLPLVWIVLALVLACTEHAPVYKSSFTGWLRSVWIPQRNVQDTLAILSQQRAHRRFLRCHPELHGLVRRYFRPHEKHGITPSAVTEGLEIARRFGRDRSLTLVQVLNGTIFLDDSHNKGMHRFERERLEFILDSLQTYLEGRARHCQSRRATLCSRDFEFLLVGMQSPRRKCHLTCLGHQGLSRWMDHGKPPGSFAAAIRPVARPHDDPLRWSMLHPCGAVAPDPRWTL